jgi:hypothetical protein
MEPNWLGSPQHFVGAALIAGAAVVFATTRLGIRVPIALLLGVGASMTAQVGWEVFEYLVRYANEPHASAYYDTIADSANALVGAVAGASFAAVLRARH